MTRNPTLAKPATSVAYCYASGQIAFGRRAPRGAIAFLRGPARKLRRFVEPLARRAYDGKTLLVPGIPEAPDQSAALQKLNAWLNWIEPQAGDAGIKIVPRAGSGKTAR